MSTILTIAFKYRCVMNHLVKNSNKRSKKKWQRSLNKLKRKKQKKRKIGERKKPNASTQK